jgi:hypothetical protein
MNLIGSTFDTFYLLLHFKTPNQNKKFKKWKKLFNYYEGWICEDDVSLLGPGFQCIVHIFLVDHTQCSLGT